MYTASSSSSADCHLETDSSSTIEKCRISREKGRISTYNGLSKCQKFVPRVFASPYRQKGYKGAKGVGIFAVGR